MNANSYQKLCLRSESLPDTCAITARANADIRGLHAAMGLTTEAGEFMDVFKKHILYGKEIDRINLIEELGDTLWYIAIACDYLGVSIEDVMERNIAKLKKRYPNGFTEQDAIHRDLITEKQTLEDNNAAS